MPKLIRMVLPEVIKNFISQKIELENLCLPHFYPDLNSIQDFQIGYKIDGISGKDITGKNNGDFNKNWYVICSAYAADPFFIDITENKSNFPVYFDWHGGNWKPIAIADSITDFIEKLKFLKDLESNPKNILKEFKNKFDLNNEFWSEVYDGYIIEKELPSDYTPLTDTEKRIQEIRINLRTLERDKQEGKLTLKHYLLTKRQLEKEILDLTQ